MCVCVCDGGRHRAVRTMMRSKAAGGAADTDTGAAVNLTSLSERLTSP